MLNNTTRRCPACGVVLQQKSGNSGICPRCFREFCYTRESFHSRTVSNNKTSDMDRDTKIGLLFVGIFVSFAVGLIPVGIFLAIMLAKLCNEDPKAKTNTGNKPGRIIPTGEFLKTRSDYIRVFRSTNFNEMPLGIYGVRALHQIERLEQKQTALVSMLGKNHPFLRNGDEAELYILKNCKQVYYRLKFCDQSDPEFCRLHAEYLEKVLADNEKILHDYEKLVIEVTQLDLDMPETAPCLDVLADTLHNVRTQDGTLPDDFDFEFESGFNRQMMMHG